MSVIVYTGKPRTLLARIKKAIDDKEIVTWTYDAAGHFTHVPEQWANHAWFQPIAGQGMLTFGIIGKKDVKMSKVV